MSRAAMRLVAVAVATVLSVSACEPGSRDAGSPGTRPASEVEPATAAGPGPAGTEAAADPRPSATSPPASPPARRPPARPATSPPARPRPAGCPQGEKQRQVEQYLAQLGGFGTVTVDGRQSAADCAAIKKFQRRYGISPAAGRAGPTTADVARRLATTRTDRCSTGSGTTFCVDLTRQTVWAMRGGRVVMGPTVTRTGMSGFATTTGVFKIGWKNIREWSDPYEVWLPYWQQFHGGMGFHETTTYLHNGAIGSHGCVNLLPTDSRRLWELGKVGTRVHVFGRRPGT